MRTHYPDKWVIFGFEHPSEESRAYKVLGSWAGGYLDGDSWRSSSGVTAIEEHDDHYLVHNHSGSTYYCHKEAIGMRMYTEGVFKDFRENSTLENDVKLHDISEIIEQYRIDPVSVEDEEPSPLNASPFDDF